jgi:hypothetical protein
MERGSGRLGKIVIIISNKPVIMKFTSPQTPLPGEMGLKQFLFPPLRPWEKILPRYIGRQGDEAAESF